MTGIGLCTVGHKLLKWKFPSQEDSKGNRKMLVKYRSQLGVICILLLLEPFPQLQFHKHTVLSSNSGEKKYDKMSRTIWE